MQARHLKNEKVEPLGPTDFLTNVKQALAVRPTITNANWNNQGTVLSREASFRLFWDLDRVRFAKWIINKV